MDEEEEQEKEKGQRLLFSLVLVSEEEKAKEGVDLQKTCLVVVVAFSFFQFFFLSDIHEALICDRFSHMLRSFLFLSLMSGIYTYIYIQKKKKERKG